MVDLSDKSSDQVSESEEMSSQIPTPERISFSDGANIKTCADCGTTKTPLWRGGPAGPKSLCNACGIRSRKKRRAIMGGPNKEEKKTKKPTIIKQSTHQIHNNVSSSSSSSEESSSKFGKSSSLKRKLMGFGSTVPLQRPRSSSRNQRRRKIGEVEQAAFLLMALSCGSVYA